MTAPISNGPTTHGYTTMRDATQLGNAARKMFRNSPATGGQDYSEKPSHNKRFETRGIQKARSRWDGLADVYV